MEAEQPYLGDLLTMVINHVSKSWDDPPSSLPSSQVFRRLRVLAKSQEYYTITDAIQELCKWAMKNGTLVVEGSIGIIILIYLGSIAPYIL